MFQTYQLRVAPTTPSLTPSSCRLKSCEECRSTKKRCDRARGICARCDRLGKTCVYTSRKSRYSPLPSSEKAMIPAPSIPSSPPLPQNSRAVPKLCPVILQVAPTVTSSTFVMAEPASPSTVSALSDTSSGGLFPPFQSGAEKCEAPRYHPIMSVSNLID
ncbi:hypothetical protein BJ741DRAFT_590747 [Chytriomyces cf. hyalinus JEL632]|nr:hypothetical protein BJ741DRAFT_590747 [Chytriomyces cf. hyalinus JEL632]